MNWFHWALLAALFAGITAVLAKAGTRDVETNLATEIRTTVVLALSWVIVLAGGKPEWGGVTGRAVVFLVLSGVATGLSWLCYLRALQLGEVSTVASVDKLSVVFAIALAAIFLGERLLWRHWLGSTLIVGGAIVMYPTGESRRGA